MPIVERELRVASRHARTWWRRVLTLGVALAASGFMYLTMGRYAGPSEIGRMLFSVLGSLAMVYGLLTGPLATADCLSRERREGTLGLLFLTDLRGHDVVLGKVAASALDMVLGLMAALPLLALPLLLGGVTLSQFLWGALALLDLVFLSLAVGVCVSSLVISSRTALALTVGFLLFLTLGLPWLGESVFRVGLGGRITPWFYLVCPFYTMVLCLDPPMRQPLWNLVANLGAIHLLAWLCLLVACRRTAVSWRDLPASAFWLRWRGRFDRWRRGDTPARAAWRRRLLDQNPVGWIDGRRHLQDKAIWLLIFASAGFWVLRHVLDPNSWPDADVAILWPLFAHWILCFWIALQAPHRLADDKQSGALELLMCTSLPEGAIVRGNLRLLWRRFGWPLVALLVLDVLMLGVYFDAVRGWPNLANHDVFQLAIYGVVVFPLQAWSFAKVGVYEGLVRGSSIRATINLVWKLGVLPWVVWIGFLLGWMSLSRGRMFGLTLSEEVAFGSWGIFHLAVCGLFLAHASRQLRWNFRQLAAQPAPIPWWRRLWPVRDDLPPGSGG